MTVPNLAPAACRHPHCPDLAGGPRGWCPRHDPGPFAGTAAMPTGWGRIRAAVLRRDRHRCVRCGLPAVTVNHITARALGGTDEMSNLESLCRRCHDMPRQGGQVSGVVRRSR